MTWLKRAGLILGAVLLGLLCLGLFQWHRLSGVVQATKERLADEKAAHEATKAAAKREADLAAARREAAAKEAADLAAVDAAHKATEDAIAVREAEVDTASAAGVDSVVDLANRRLKERDNAQR